VDIGSDRLLENACGSSDVVVVNSFLLSTDGVDTNAFDKFTNSILEVLDSEEGSGEDLSVKHRSFRLIIYINLTNVIYSFHFEFILVFIFSLF
jgi:hypothetical protein